MPYINPQYCSDNKVVLEQIRHFLQVANAGGLCQAAAFAYDLNERGLEEHIQDIRDQIDRMIAYVSMKLGDQ